MPVSLVLYNPVIQTVIAVIGRDLKTWDVRTSAQARAISGKVTNTFLRCAPSSDPNPNPIPNSR